MRDSLPDGLEVCSSFPNQEKQATLAIIDKKKDIFVLRSLGANYKLIRQIFLFEGWMISFIGAIVGLLFGVLICYLQEQFGLIELQGSGSFVIDNYPVKVEIVDLFSVFFEFPLLTEYLYNLVHLNIMARF